MTLEEAIQHHQKVATTFGDKDSEQLACWLTELQEYRSKALEKPKTNGDRIRHLTDEKMLAVIGIGCHRCIYSGDECNSGYGGGCAAGNLAWLKQEVEDAGTD